MPTGYTLVIDHATPIMAARLLANGAMSRCVECETHPGWYNLAVEADDITALTEIIFKLRDIEQPTGGA